MVSRCGSSSGSRSSVCGASCNLDVSAQDLNGFIVTSDLCCDGVDVDELCIVNLLEISG